MINLLFPLQTINAEFCQSQRQLDLLTNSAAELTEMCDEAVSKSLLHSVNQVKDGSVISQHALSLSQSDYVVTLTDR